MARRLRSVVDLYTVGRTMPLRDGSLLWVQALNPFEQDTARNEAQIAKARLSMAIREFGGDEQAKVKMFFLDDGIEEARDKLIDAQAAINSPRVVETFRNDPEWTERLQIMDRGDADTARPLEEAETELMTKIIGEFSAELTKRLTDERDFLTAKYEMADEETLWSDYLDWFIERRSAEVMLGEFRVHQAYFGVRVCDGVTVQQGEFETWDHAACAGHTQRLFADHTEVRSAPADLLEAIQDAFDNIDLSLREAKNSDRQGSSSDSSPLPSEAEASTASTPAETRVELLGSSPSPSPTPSLSSASVS